MARLGQLPTELLRLIATFITQDPIVGHKKGVSSDNSDGKSEALAALAITNRYFNQVFEPLLYRWDAQVAKVKSVTWALEEESIETLEKAFAAGFDFNRPLSPNLDVGRGTVNTSIHRVLAKGDEHILRWLLGHGAKPDVDGPMEIKGLPSPLAYEDQSALKACLDGTRKNEEAALILLDHGARVFFAHGDFAVDNGSYVHERDITVTSALQHAASSGFPRVVERLLQDGMIEVDYRDSSGFTALDCALQVNRPNAAVVQLLLQHGADPTLSYNNTCDRAIALAFSKGHVGSLDPLLRHITRGHLKEQHLSHLYLWYILKLLDRRQEYVRGNLVPSSRDPHDTKAILSKLVEFGADFENPPPPYLKKVPEPLIMLASSDFGPIVFIALLEIGVNPFVQYDDETLFDQEWYAHLSSRHTPWPVAEDDPRVAALLKAGARMDVKDPSTDLTALESAVEACDNEKRPCCAPLQFLLEQATASTLASDHIYEILDSQIDNLEKHLVSSIIIMQHGWISPKARSYVFEWLFSYVTFSPVKHPTLHFDEKASDEAVEFGKKAARFFPKFLNRRQLDMLWETGVVHRVSKEYNPAYEHWRLRQRWSTIPWWNISAARNDVAAMHQLKDLRHKLLDTAEDNMDQAMKVMAANDNVGGRTPLMRALWAGSREAAMWLLQNEVEDSDGSRLACDHPENDGAQERNPNAEYLCFYCPHGHRTAFEIAVYRGEVECFEAMWNLANEKTTVPRPNWESYLDMPRVFSYSNVMVEWMQMSLGTKEWMRLNMSGHDAWLREETQKRLASLRAEIVEVRDAWRASAKRLEREDK